MSPIWGTFVTTTSSPPRVARFSSANTTRVQQTAQDITGITPIKAGDIITDPVLIMMSALMTPVFREVTYLIQNFKKI